MKPALFVPWMGVGQGYVHTAHPLLRSYSKHITAYIHVATYRRTVETTILHPSFSSQVRLLACWRALGHCRGRANPAMHVARNGRVSGNRSGAPSTFLMARLGPARSGFARLNGGRSLARRIAARVSASNTLSVFSANAEQRSCTATKDFLDGGSLVKG